MLIEFEVGNFLSFHQPVRLSMYAATPFKEFEADNVFKAGGRRMLKSAVIYGANASGKSNLLAALGHMRWLVLNSSKESQAGEPIDVRPFKLDVNSVKQPSRFEVVFRIDETSYRYGFEADTKQVCSEWLFKIKGKAEAPLFLREKDDIEVHSGFHEGVGLEDKTRDNALFLSVVAQLNGRLSGSILAWFRAARVLHGWQDDEYSDESVNMLDEEEWHTLLVKMLRAADIGIQDLFVKEADDDPWFKLRDRSVAKAIYSFGPSSEGKAPLRRKSSRMRMRDGRLQSVSIASIHGKYENGEKVGNATLDFDSEESEGTRKFFRLAGPILKCLERSGVAVVDEIDAKLHPLLTRGLVGLFNSAETNPHNAQLIFCSHDATLLTHSTFRRDQIWFSEKNQCEATDLYSLAEFKGVRKDASFDKDYIKGRYGAIPFLGDFRELLMRKEGKE